MSNIDWFRFENKDSDFPFYNNNPHIPKWGWIVLLFAMIMGLILSISSNLIVLILACAVIIVPVLYFLKWDYAAIFKKLSAKDVALALGLFAGYIVYAIAMDFVLGNFGIVGGDLIGPNPTWMDVPPLFFSLMVEEFLKFIPFMFFLRVAFKFSNNRKLSVIVSMALVMLFFASLHAYNLNMLVYAIFIQGLGSIFEFIGYIKTKNILVSYITHVATDVFGYAMVLMGF